MHEYKERQCGFCLVQNLLEPEADSILSWELHRIKLVPDDNVDNPRPHY